MIKVWKAKLDTGEYTRGSLLNLKEFRGVKTTLPETLAGKFPGAHIRIDSEDPPADFFTVGTLFIISRKLKSVLDEFPLVRELYTVDVRYKEDRSPIGSYFFLHILDTADCLDRANSQFKEEKGYVGDITKLVIDESKAAGKHLFRLAHAYQRLVFASEELATAVEAAGITGVRLQDPASWRR